MNSNVQITEFVLLKNLYHMVIVSQLEAKLLCQSYGMAALDGVDHRLRRS